MHVSFRCIPASYIILHQWLQGSINIDRFYNLLPFVNRMPRNQFYANLSSRVTGRCIDSARKNGKPAPGEISILHPG